MKLEGIHHITAITADAPGNVEFYAGLLGLRLVKKTVNQDDPTVYHLFYADEHGSPGSDLTFFEYPHAAPGRAGAGLVHRVIWRDGSSQALDFWEQRLNGRALALERTPSGLLFQDPEGLAHELVLDTSQEPRLLADSPEVPSEFALAGFDGARAYTSDRAASENLLAQTLNFEDGQDGRWRVAGLTRSSCYAFDPPPEAPPIQGAGTVHHIAFASPMDDHEGWQRRIADAGAHPTPVIDRFYFRSIYFREPSGVLFEIASIGPGFAADEDSEHLGERLSLPPRFEPLRARLQEALTPLPNPRLPAGEHAS